MLRVDGVAVTASRGRRRDAVAAIPTTCLSTRRRRDAVDAPPAQAPHLGPGAAGRKKRKVSLQAPAGHVAKPPMSRARARPASVDDAGFFVRGVSRDSGEV